MKRIISISIILVLLLGLSLSGLKYIDYTRDDMSVFLDEIKVELDRQDMDIEQLQSLCDKACDRWEEHSQIIGTFAIHDTIDTLENSFATLSAYANENHFASIAPLLEEIEFHLHHLYEQELPILKNIL